MNQPVHLWLFDIDGTLVDTGGAGMRSLKEAAEKFFGDEGPELDLAGSTDSGIVRGMFAHFSREHDEAGEREFYEFYLQRLEWNLAHGGFPGRVLPGAEELLRELSKHSHITVGLLTGNTEGGARVKMRHYGLDEHFPFGAYGCDHWDRNLLGPIALQRAEAHRGRPFTPAETLVIGDTPKDIACAAALGSRCLAVATGAFLPEGLQGADRVAESLDSPELWAEFL